MIEMHNLTLGYDRHPAIHHLQCNIKYNSLLAIAGPNGAGKSTLFKGMMGQLKPLDGEIRLNGTTREAIGYLPQQNHIDRSFPITVGELVGLGCWRKRGAFGRLRRSDREDIRAAIEQVGLAGFEKRTIATLSGGQMQRVLFARLMVQQADLILLDEPFNAIDTKTCDDLLALIHHWHGQGKTVLAVLHDMEQIRQHFPTTLLISRKVIGYGETATVLTPENLIKARQLNEAFDDHAQVCTKTERAA
jgi:zinc/manganese transport system ATP-binding protein